MQKRGEKKGKERQEKPKLVKGLIIITQVTPINSNGPTAILNQQTTVYGRISRSIVRRFGLALVVQLDAKTVEGCHSQRIELKSVITLHVSIGSASARGWSGW